MPLMDARSVLRVTHGALHAPDDQTGSPVKGLLTLFSFRSTDRPQECRRAALVSWKEACIAQRGAVNDLLWTLIMAGKLGADVKVGSSTNEQLGDGKAKVPNLACSVKQRGLTSNPVFADQGLRVDCRTVSQEQRCGFEAAVLGCHVEECCATKSQATTSGGAEVELGKAPVNEPGVLLEQLGKAIESSAQKIKDSRDAPSAE